MNIKSLNYPFFINIFGNIESEKIGFYFSFCLHFIFLIFIIGFPDFFKSAPINIPTVIPIEIVNITNRTSIPIDIEKTKNQEKIAEKLESKKFNNVENQEVKKVEMKTKPVKFNNVENQEIKKVEIKTKPEKINKEDKIIQETKKEMKVEQNFKNLIELKDIQEVIEEEKIESLPSKKIQPKRKPKPKKIEKEATLDIDIAIKDKPKPKFNFDISSMLKDLRNDQTLMNTEQAEKVLTKDKPIKQSKNKESKVQLSISEIDLLIQQLSSCWSAPAGAVIKKGMVVKISAKIKPDRNVLYQTVRIIDTNISQSNPFYGPITESAMRTLLNPECSPLKLPEDKYDLWKNLTINFDHSIMKGYQ